MYFENKYEIHLKSPKLCEPMTFRLASEGKNVAKYLNMLSKLNARIKKFKYLVQLQYEDGSNMHFLQNLKESFMYTTIVFFIFYIMLNIYSSLTDTHTRIRLLD